MSKSIYEQLIALSHGNQSTKQIIIKEGTLKYVAIIANINFSRRGLHVNVSSKRIRCVLCCFTEEYKKDPVFLITIDGREDLKFSSEKIKIEDFVLTDHF